MPQSKKEVVLFLVVAIVLFSFVGSNMLWHESTAQDQYIDDSDASLEKWKESWKFTDKGAAQEEMKAKNKGKSAEDDDLDDLDDQQPDKSMAVNALTLYKKNRFKNVAFTTIMDYDEDESLIQNVVGSMHRFHRKSSILVYIAPKVSKEVIDRVRKWSHVTVILIKDLSFKMRTKEQKTVMKGKKGNEGDDEEEEEEEDEEDGSTVVTGTQLYDRLSQSNRFPLFVIHHGLIEHKTVLYVDKTLSLIRSVSPVLKIVRASGAFLWENEKKSKCDFRLQAYTFKSHKFLKLHRYVECLLGTQKVERCRKKSVAYDECQTTLPIVKAREEMKTSQWRDLNEVNLMYLHQSKHAKNALDTENAENDIENDNLPGLEDHKHDQEDTEHKAHEDDKNEESEEQEGEKHTHEQDVDVVRAHKEGKTVIAMLVATISKGFSSVESLPMYRDLIPSMVKSVTQEESKKFMFAVYLGYDKGDAIYDNENNLASVKALVDQRKGHLDIVVKTLRVEGMTGKPVWVWNAIGDMAFKDGVDYFYQANDDLEIITPGWASSFIKTLRHNPTHPNFGVVGPKDIHNDKTITQAFVHRTHFVIHGQLYPSVYHNWYSDDYLTWVYRKDNTFWDHNFQAKNINSGGARYPAHNGAPLMNPQLAAGCERIQKYLGKHDMTFDCTPQRHWWDPPEEEEEKK